jgi:hypothetical protein
MGWLGYLVISITVMLQQRWELMADTMLKPVEDGVSILNSWTCTGVWPCKVNGQDLDRMSSDNTLEDLEFSVDTCEKL